MIVLTPVCYEQFIITYILLFLQVHVRDEVPTYTDLQINIYVMNNFFAALRIFSQVAKFI